MSTEVKSQDKLQMSQPQRSSAISMTLDVKVLGATNSEQNPKTKSNFKWTIQEHAKYVLFLERNKLKIKSKLVRRSNAFFKEMEKFIVSRTSLQCRSHHQKYQDKYKFPHRIITGEKRHLPQSLYQQIIEEVRTTGHSTNHINDHFYDLQVHQEYVAVKPKKCYSIECQTQLSGVNRNMVLEQQICQKVVVTSEQLYSTSYLQFIHPVYQYYSAFPFMF